MNPSAVIFGLSGPRLTRAEKLFFRDTDPWAFILFARNIETPAQVIRLTSELRDSVGRDCLIFVDQEGGRVQRLRPPHWTNYPAAARFGEIYDCDPEQGKRASFLAYRLIADDLKQLGINADCAPVLDLPKPNADPIISDRAFAKSTAPLIELAHACMAGLMAGGVAPVIKHIPGHGRAKVDSHKALPRIDTSRQTFEKTDFIPFQAFCDAPMAMTAHAVFSCSDDTPVTTSQKAMTELVRAAIGFDGLVMSDDLDMKALSGSLTQKTRRALRAGCDIALHCSGHMKDMVKVAKGAKPLEGRALERALIAQYCGEYVTPFDRAAAQSELSHILGAENLLEVAA